MLTIYRMPGKSFRCTGAKPDDVITVYVDEVKGAQVKLRVNAPKHVRIEREDRNNAREISQL